MGINKKKTLTENKKLSQTIKSKFIAYVEYISVGLIQDTTEITKSPQHHFFTTAEGVETWSTCDITQLQASLT